MDWHLFLVSFLLIFPVELPDKTFVAALVLSTRYRPFPVWIGVGLAFGVQCLVAVTAGQAVSFLPEWFVPRAEHADVPGRRDHPVPAGAEGRRRGAGAGGGVRPEGDQGPEGLARRADVVPRAVRGRVGRPVADPHPQPGGEVRLAALDLLRVVGRAAHRLRARCHRRPGAAALHAAVVAPLHRGGRLPGLRRGRRLQLASA